MKKVLVALLLVVGSLGVFAQANTGYFAILPGYQFASSSHTYDSYWFWAKAEGDNDFTFSLDGGYFFTDNVGLHFGYTWMNGDYDVKITDKVFGFDWGTYKFNRKINIIEIGPEFVGKAGDKGEIYGQINLGYTFGSGDTHFYYGNSRYDLGNEGGNDWTYGAAFGYRYYFNDKVGLNLQGTYHHLQEQVYRDVWDAKIGVVFKF